MIWLIHILCCRIKNSPKHMATQIFIVGHDLLMLWVAFLSYSKYLCPHPPYYHYSVHYIYVHILGLDHNENDERVVGSITKYTLGSVLPPFSAYCHYSSIDVSSVTLIGNKWKQNKNFTKKYYMYGYSISHIYIICIYQKYFST